MRKLVLLSLMSLTLSAQEGENCVRASIYFDLGNTLVDTRKDGSTENDYSNMHYLRDVSSKTEDGTFRWKDGPLYQDAQDYLHALQERGHVLGMITDVPESWGVNYPAREPVLDYSTAKIIRLIDFLSGKVPEDNTSWMQGAAPLDISPFGEFRGQGREQIFKGEMLLPQKDIERKTKNSQGIGGSTILFERALARAQTQGCPAAVYQGEDAEEMKLAEAAGMIPFQIGVTSQEYFYLPVEKIDWYIANYRSGLWQGLGEIDF